MPSSRRDLTDAQWEFLDSLIPEPPRRRDGRGRPWRERHEVLNGILFILRTGSPWADCDGSWEAAFFVPNLSTLHVQLTAHFRSTKDREGKRASEGAEPLDLRLITKDNGVGSRTTLQATSAQTQRHLWPTPQHSWLSRHPSNRRKCWAPSFRRSSRCGSSFRLR